MEPKLDGKQGFSGIFEEFAAQIFTKTVLPFAEAANQPLETETSQQEIALSERCKEAVAEAGQVIENLMAEVIAELVAEKQAQFEAMAKTMTQLVEDKQAPFNGKAAYTYATEERSKVAVKLNQPKANSANDLRLLLMLGLGVLTLQQWLDKGFQIEELPWYILTCCAFDALIKPSHKSANLQTETSSASETP
jgi:roadblock/LC7 domain-containing protein